MTGEDVKSQKSQLNQYKQVPNSIFTQREFFKDRKSSLMTPLQDEKRGQIKTKVTRALMQSKVQKDLVREFLDNEERTQKLIDQLSVQQKYDHHVNVLIIMDDMVSDLKKQEHSPRLGQLFLNRRNILYNGTISIIVVSQKYTMIPSRIRSNANWLILFKLNPLDFDLVYKQSVTMHKDMWAQLLEYVFGTESDSGDQDKEMKQLIAEKKHDFLQIWVEYNVYFKKFDRLVFNK